MSRRMLTIMSFKVLLTVIKVRGPNGHGRSHATARGNFDSLPTIHVPYFRKGLVLFSPIEKLLEHAKTFGNIINFSSYLLFSIQNKYTRVIYYFVRITTKHTYTHTHIHECLFSSWFAWQLKIDRRACDLPAHLCSIIALMVPEGLRSHGNKSFVND